MDMPSPPPAQLGRLRSAAPPPSPPTPFRQTTIAYRIIVVVSSSSSWYGALYSIADSLIDNPHRILVTANSTVQSLPYLCRIVITTDATITKYHRSRHPPRRGCYRCRRLIIIIITINRRRHCFCNNHILSWSHHRRTATTENTTINLHINLKRWNGRTSRCILAHANNIVMILLRW